MSPIIDLIGSAKVYGWGSAGLLPPSYESISTVNVTGNTSTINFTSIPSTFKHLQLRAICRTNRVAVLSNIYLRFNSDSNTNYAWHRLEGNGSSASADTSASATGYQVSIIGGGASTPSNVFGIAVIDILDYKNTDKFKTVRSFSGLEANDTSGRARITTASWRSTNAITSIALEDDTLASFVQYSNFSLYGIKGE